MVNPTQFAMGEVFSKPVQILAIVGGAAVGAFLFGLIAQLMSRWLTTKPLPPFPTNTIRFLGAALFGLLTAMWVWQGGSWGPGGLGGPGTTEATGPGDIKPDADKGPPKDEHEASKDQSKPADKGLSAPPEAVLRIEVLTDPALAKLPGATEQDVREGRYYKLEGDDEVRHLRTLTEITKFIRERIADKPPLRRLDIVTRPDSPDKSAARVSRLREAITALAPDLNVEYPPR